MFSVHLLAAFWFQAMWRNTCKTVFKHDNCKLLIPIKHASVSRREKAKYIAPHTDVLHRDKVTNYTSEGLDMTSAIYIFAYIEVISTSPTVYYLPAWWTRAARGTAFPSLLFQRQWFRKNRRRLPLFRKFYFGQCLVFLEFPVQSTADLNNSIRTNIDRTLTIHGLQ